MLVEGWSDQAAVETLAPRVGYDLTAMGIVVLPIGGATNLRRFAAYLGGQGLGLALSGLYDLAEERHFLGGLQPCRATTALDRADAERLGFIVCDEDLEDELISALGPATIVFDLAALQFWSTESPPYRPSRCCRSRC